MKRFVIGAAVLGMLTVNAGAQELPEARAGSFFVGPYAGYMFFGDLFESRDGSVEFSNEDGAIFGAQAGVNITPSVALLGNLAYSKSAWTFEPATGGSVRQSVDLGIYFYDASLQFRIPTNSTRISPLAQLGVGMVKYTYDTDDVFSDGESDVAFNVGLGADVGLARGVALRLMAKDYITSKSWNDIESVDFDDNIEGNVAHNIGLSVGLRIGR